MCLYEWSFANVCGQLILGWTPYISTYLCPRCDKFCSYFMFHHNEMGYDVQIHARKKKTKLTNLALFKVSTHTHKFKNKYISVIVRQVKYIVYRVCTVYLVGTF